AVETDLSATDDLAIFPRVLTIEPQQERRVRVAAATAFTPSEKSYRLFVEELPPLDTVSTSPSGSGVQMLTRYSIPIFLHSGKGEARSQIDAATLEGDHLNV